MARPRPATTKPSRKATLLFLALALYLGGTMVKLCTQEITLLKQAQVLEAEKTEVLALHTTLREEIALAKTNAGIERLARAELGLVKASEIPVLTAENPASDGAATGVATARPAGLPPAMAALARYFTTAW